MVNPLIGQIKTMKAEMLVFLIYGTLFNIVQQCNHKPYNTPNSKTLDAKTTNISNSTECVCISGRGYVCARYT